MIKTRKPKLLKRRSPIGKAVSKMPNKVKPGKKKYPLSSIDQPTTKDYSYNTDGTI